MKILLVSNSLTGGAGKACLRLYFALQAKNIDVRLLYLEPCRHPADSGIASFYPSVSTLFIRQLISQPAVKLENWWHGNRSGHYRLPSSIHSLEQHPWVDWADLINLHWVPNFVDYKTFFSTLKNKPIVWTMHDLLPFSGGFHYESELGHRNRPLEQRIKTIKANAVTKARLSIVAPSEWALEESKCYGTFSSLSHTHIFNGLPLDVYKPIDKPIARRILNLPEDRKIALFVADSLDAKRKGMKNLCEAIHILQADNVLFVSMGGGKLPIEPGINYRSLGSMADDTSLALVYSCADLVVVPSIEDNSPNTIIESFACGRPVVGMAVGGIPQLISAPELGVTVEESTPQALAQGISNALRTDYSEDRIRRYAERNFGLDCLGQNYLNEFERAIRNES